MSATDIGLIVLAEKCGAIADAEMFSEEMRKTDGVKSAKELTTTQADEVLDQFADHDCRA
jgi:hypothetical protein